MTALFVSVAAVALASFLLTTNGFKLAPSTHTSYNLDSRVRQLPLIRRGDVYSLCARKSKRGEQSDSNDDEAQWDEKPEAADNQMILHGEDDIISNDEWTSKTTPLGDDVGEREIDFFQNRDLDLILTERATRFYDPKLSGIEKEKCILVAVDTKLETRRTHVDSAPIFSLKESLSELSELVGTAGLQVMGCCVQRLYSANSKTYVGSGKVQDIMAAVNATGAKTIVIDDDLSTRQQRNLEDAFASLGGSDVKVLDRTAVILEIFAQHAQSREGQLQVELAMLEYRLTRGPKASGGEGDKGCGFRGPGETKMETDKRAIREKIVILTREISLLGMQREQHRKSRMRLGLPVVALVGYTNAGKSTLLNRLSRAGVLAENMLFATLDPTTRRVQLPKSGSASASSSFSSKDDKIIEANVAGVRSKGQEVLLTDTVGFISKLPTDLIAAFRATLEEVGKADVLIHVIDRSSPVYEKQKETVLRELDAIGCSSTPIVELWNKIDCMEDPESVMMEAMYMPVDVEAIVSESDYGENDTYDDDSYNNEDEDEINAKIVNKELDVYTDIINDAEDDDETSSNPKENTESKKTENEEKKVEKKDEQKFFWDKESNEKNSKKVNEEDSYQWEEEETYVRDTLPDSGREKGRSSSGKSDTHSNTQFHKNYLDKKMQLEVEKEKEIQRLRRAEEGIEEDEDGEESGMRGAGSDNDSEVGSDVQFSVSISNIYDQPQVGELVSMPKGDGSETNPNRKGRPKGRGRSVNIRPPRKTFTVAASVKSGLGFSEFLETLESALSLLLKPISVFVPFDRDDGIIAMIHSQGSVDRVEYNNVGTSISCRVPDALYSRLQSYKEKVKKE